MEKADMSYRETDSGQVGEDKEKIAIKHKVLTPNIRWSQTRKSIKLVINGREIDHEKITSCGDSIQVEFLCDGYMYFDKILLFEKILPQVSWVEKEIRDEEEQNRP